MAQDLENAGESGKIYYWKRAKDFSLKHWAEAKKRKDSRNIGLFWIGGKGNNSNFHSMVVIQVRIKEDGWDNCLLGIRNYCFLNLPVMFSATEDIGKKEEE